MKQKKLLPLSVIALATIALGAHYLRSKDSTARSNHRTTSPTSTGSVSGDDSILSDNPNERLSPSEEEEHIFRTYFSQMSDEDKEAKPQDFPIELWARLGSMHYHDLKQHGEIRFYGRIVDEEGVPLSGVSVMANIKSYHRNLLEVRNTNSRFKEENIQLTSNESGLFEVIDHEGLSLGLSSFRKDGYELDETGTYGFNFSPEDSMSGAGERHVADPARPVVYSMRRTNL